MKKTDVLVSLLDNDIANKRILEVGCGSADFSISAGRYACSVSCIDIDSGRLSNELPSNVNFEIMDACNLRYSDESFDTVFLYNAFSHIYSQWDLIKAECIRVLKPSGKIYIVSTWKLDTSLMNEVFGNTIENHKGFYIVKLER